MLSKDFLQTCARDLGFSVIGVASSQKLVESEHLSLWLENDYCGTMNWLRRNADLRSNPAALLTDAKSVICVALKYGEEGLQGFGRKFDKKRAKFARGEDYHEVLLKKLKDFWRKVEEYAPKAKAKFCVDTTPVLEKALAVQAGIGWQGKHTIIINPDYGSYFVLGEIITDLELEVDRPVANRCGDCKRCVEACPTGAIISPYVLNAGLCISYLTIEHKGPIPGEFKKFIKDGQYGCDLCQEVCPFNAI